VSQPPNGRGRIQGDQVKVSLGPRPVTVGRIKDGSLHPSSIIQPRDVQKIIEGNPIRLTHKKDQVVLIFRRQVQQQTKEPGKRPPKGGARSNGKVKI
jgi:hypothetical protein